MIIYWLHRLGVPLSRVIPLWISYGLCTLLAPVVFWICSIVGMLASVWGAVVTFTNPWVPLFSRGDWFKVVLALSVISLAFAPIIYVIGSAVARKEPLPPEAEAVAGAGSYWSSSRSSG